MARAIDSEVAYQFLTEQKIEGTGARAQGVNKGLDIARSAMRNPDAIPTLTPQWISVKERLPEAEQEVCVACKTRTFGYRYQCQGFYVPRGVYREDSEFAWDYEACDEYDEERDDYLVNEGWYERIHNWDEYGAVSISDIVTHWMPLPDPPNGKEALHE